MARTLQTSHEPSGQQAWTLLAAAARITRETDRDAADAALLVTLAETWDLHDAHLYVLKDGKRPACRRLVSLCNGHLARGSSLLAADHDQPLTHIPGGEQAATRGTATLTSGTDGYTMVWPIHNHQQRPIRLLQLGASCQRLLDDRAAVQALLGLYQNHLNVIEDAELDSLTGLRNRRTFDHLLVNLLEDRRTADRLPAASRRHSSATANWLAVLDIDRFKSINDRFGHLIGDEVLILVANLMTRSFRADDAVFRFGGEEFVVVLCGVDAAGAGAAVERLRSNMAAKRFPQVGNITISGGYTEIGEGELSSEVLNRADAALYYAKANGRNRTCCYEALLADGQISPTQSTSGGGVELF